MEENRRKNDVIFIPVGSTELHGKHMALAMDTFFVSAICEGVRRYTAKRGAPTQLDAVGRLSVPRTACNQR